MNGKEVDEVMKTVTRRKKIDYSHENVFFKKKVWSFIKEILFHEGIRLLNMGRVYNLSGLYTQIASQVLIVLTHRGGWGKALFIHPVVDTTLRLGHTACAQINIFYSL